MIEVISVRFRGGCKSYFFDPQGLSVPEGEQVVVETAQGAEIGTCVRTNHAVEDHAVIQPLRPVRRIAGEEDKRTAEKNRQREKEAMIVCEKKIAAHKLELKLVDVECSFEGNKIIFFFTADGRVDFRELVKDLAGVFHARIELRQIGVRDEAKMLGGLGICGQPFCCKRFLEDFQPVSIKMAKTQNLSLNPAKISGSCGRLMCCLKYEQHAYEDAQTRMPKNDSFVQTPDGPGNISAVNLVRETVTVRLDDAPEAPKTYQVDEIIVLRSGKGGREGIDIPPRPARIEKEAALDEFGMEIVEREPFVRQFRNSPSARRETAERSESKEGKGSKENRREPKAPSGDAGEKERSREKASSRRSHRGGRGRRGGEERGEKKQDQEAKPVFAPQSGAPRPVRFGSSMPIAGNAAVPAGEERAKEGNRSRRRSRRGGRRGRGSGGDTPAKEN